MISVSSIILSIPTLTVVKEDIQSVNARINIKTCPAINNASDAFVVEEKMIKGIVKTRIPFIGYPTVWLNNL